MTSMIVSIPWVEVLRTNNAKSKTETGIDLLGNKKETESVQSKDFIISYPLSSIQIEVP